MSAAGPTSASAREAEMRELREFWKTYMRTPMTDSSSVEQQQLQQQQQQPPQQQHLAPPSPSGTRRVRVASLPSVKTPTGEASEAGIENGNGTSSIRTTLHGNDDLRSYHAAVLARKGCMTLTLPRKGRNGFNRGSGEGSELRPSFKRLPSQTLGPANAKRTQMSQEDTDNPLKSAEVNPGNISKMLSGVEKGRRRLSAPDDI
jgi:hypothetical protein